MNHPCDYARVLSVLVACLPQTESMKRDFNTSLWLRYIDAQLPGFLGDRTNVDAQAKFEELHRLTPDQEAGIAAMVKQNYTIRGHEGIGETPMER